MSCAEFYFQNICVSHITWYYQKVVANFRLGDRWEKNQLTWFLTKVIIVIDVLIFIIFIVFIITIIIIDVLIFILLVTFLLLVIIIIYDKYF